VSVAVAVVGLFFVVLGSVLPWASAATPFGSLSVAGTEGDGVATVVLGGVGLTGAAVALTGRRLAIVVSIVVAGVAFLVGLYDMASITGTGEAGVQVGIGLWMLLIGAVVAFGAGIASLLR
jgi:hypothetical protein